MKFSNFKQDKGVAGLTILLSLVTMIFIIGLLIMIFSLMGVELQDTTIISAGESTTATQNDVNITPSSALTACTGQRNGVITAVSTVVNSSGGAWASGDWAVSGCTVSNQTPILDLTNITYTFSWAGEGFEIINDTVVGVGSAVDWFDIFIVIGAMVVLILLTVIIVTAIRGSGLMAGGGEGSGGAGNIGSA